MGHAAFYAVGAYTTAILNTRLPDPHPVDAPGERRGGGALRRRSWPARSSTCAATTCSIVTIGLGEIVRIALVNDVFGLTGGANGIFGISRPIALRAPRIRRPHEFFYLIWGFVAVTVLLFHRLEQSRFGRALNYLREDEVAAEGSGVNTARYRLARLRAGRRLGRHDRHALRGQDDDHLPRVVRLLGVGRPLPDGDPGRLRLDPRRHPRRRRWWWCCPELFRGFASARMLVFGARHDGDDGLPPAGAPAALPRSYALPSEPDVRPGRRRRRERPPRGPRASRRASAA